MSKSFSDMTDGEAFVWIVKRIILAIILLVVVFGSFGTVKAGQIGVKTRFGKVVNTVQPGLYMKTPILDSVHKMDVKTRTINYDKNTAEDAKEGDALDTAQLFGASKDLQDVKIGVVVTYHVDPTKAADIYSQYSSVDNYESNVIEPMVRQVVKSTSAEFTAEELVTKRAEYSDKVNATLTEELTGKSAILENFSVTNFEFSAEFSKAIESKVTATQNAEAAKNKLEQIKFEAEQTVVTAKAEAEAQTIKARALESSGGKQVVELEAIKVQRAAVEKWNGIGCNNNCYAGNPTMPIPFLNLTK